MEEKVRSLLQQAINGRIFPGCVIGYIRGGEEVIIPLGRLTYEVSSPPVQETTLYDVASITKAIPTSSLALFLVDQGELSLEDTVTSFLPEFIHKEVTIWHLLTHTVSFSLRLSQEKQLPPDALWQKVLTAPLHHPLGSTFSYANISSILLGRIIEKVLNKPLDKAAEEIFFRPLQLKQTTFHPDASNNNQIAPTEIDPWRGGEVRGEVHDESAYVLRTTMIAGSAGLFSTVPDLLQFVRMLLAGGSLEGRHYFSEALIKRMTTNQIPSLEDATGLGWELNQPWYMGRFTTASTFGKTGFTGCHLVIQKDQKRAVVLLSNSTYPRRPETKERMNTLRRDLSDLIFAP